jgi:hypothetical protein
MNDQFLQALAACDHRTAADGSPGGRDMESAPFDHRAELRRFDGVSPVPLTL